MTGPFGENEAAEAFAAAGIALPLAGRLGSYAASLARANTAVNLTAARTLEAIVEHVLDALTLVPLARGPAIDVGSGGGLPGIPLGLAAGIEVTLLEAVGKKAAFLARETERLAEEFTVVPRRAETAAHEPDHRERYLTATARAVGAATETLELTLPFLALGGRALLQRGREGPGERAALDDAALILGGVVREVRGAGGDRRIIVVEKIAPTPGRFPRRVGVPAKRPLRADAGSAWSSFT